MYERERERERINKTDRQTYRQTNSENKRRGEIVNLVWQRIRRNKAMSNSRDVGGGA